MTSSRDYATLTLSYWGFTLTDGALRMLVLLHFHALGFNPLDLAFLFLTYEAMGIVTNLIGGWVATKFGLRTTLFSGLLLQVIALIALSFLQAEWAVEFSILYVMGAQALSGIAKDLTKMSSKSAVKLVIKDDDTQTNLLFKWVAILTGSKNALKGVGFFIGGLLLQTAGFTPALWIMAAGLMVILLIALTLLKSEFGKSKTKVKAKDLLSKSSTINLLSFARIFLFAARDVWFVVALPIFLYSQLGWRFDEVGGFMALWVIGYGIVQAFVPKITRNIHGVDAGAKSARNWAFWLFLVMIGLIMTLDRTANSSLVLLGGLFVFGIVFAINSALHSYLIVGYAKKDTVAMSVGFYYSANAVGRFVGTLLSGLTYQLGGLEACLIVSAAMILISAISMYVLAKPSRV